MMFIKKKKILFLIMGLCITVLIGCTLNSPKQTKDSPNMSYIVRHATGPVALDGDFYTDPQWEKANLMHLDHCYRSSKKNENAPKEEFTSDVNLKLLYDEQYIYGLFLVNDRYVKAVSTGYPQQVCTDSCVEIFIRPMNNLRYYNFEFSANGNMLLYNITELRSGKYTPVDPSEYVQIKRFHSLPSVVDPEITEPVTWRLGFAIPIDFFVRYGDQVHADLSGQVWTANVTKCADKTSNPHWLSWQDLPIVDFHLPENFGQLVFE